MSKLQGSSRIVAYEETFQRKVEQTTRNKTLTHEEKGYSGELNLRGKKAYFESYFNGTELQDQVIPEVGPFADPRTTGSFILGYQRGKMLVEQGFNYKQYQVFLDEFNQKYGIEAKQKHR